MYTRFGGLVGVKEPSPPAQEQEVQWEEGGPGLPTECRQHEAQAGEGLGGLQGRVVSGNYWPLP